MEGRRTILIVEDEPQLRGMLERYLKKEGYQVESAASGSGLRSIMARSKVDLVVLDLILPDADGIELARKLREGPNTNLGIIMLTGKGDEVDRIVGLEVGADDYITKPFSLREFLARVKSVMRRVGDPAAKPRTATSAQLVRFEQWEFDLMRRRLVDREQKEVPLTPGEFNLLKVFVENTGQVLSREALLDQTRGFGSDSLDRTIDVQINRLRQKIEVDPKNPRIIKTVRGGGYIFGADLA